MSGIYVHIPFCKKRCSYCSFYSTTLLSKKNLYIDAICREVEANRYFLEKDSVETLYFGGGTPSTLNSDDINRIYDAIASAYNLKNLKEFTLECNPDDLNSSYISSLKDTPVNRISMGIQSFDDALLSFMNRRHSASAAEMAVKLLKENGYKNISIDLIYGIPNQSMESWKESVKRAIELNIEHISAYNLSFEEGTEMYKYCDVAPDDDICEDMYRHLCSTLSENGFEHYEISNFSKPGYRSLHNSSYWKAIPYLGIGAGAHSYNIDYRFWNSEMIFSDNKISWNREEERLDKESIFNELILTSLRTKEGIDTRKIEPCFLDYFNKKAKKHIESGMLKIEGFNVSLTKKGIFISDSIIRDFILA